MRNLLPAVIAMIWANAVYAETPKGMILVEDIYAVAANPVAKTGGVFMLIENTTADGVTLLSATSDVATRIEIHTNDVSDEGVMMMHEVEEGITIPANGCAVLARGGYHVMLMGLVDGLAQGDQFDLTLNFDDETQIEVPVSVDIERGGEYLPVRESGLDECVMVRMEMMPADMNGNMDHSEMGADAATTHMGH